MPQSASRATPKAAKFRRLRSLRSTTPLRMAGDETDVASGWSTAALSQVSFATRSIAATEQGSMTTVHQSSLPQTNAPAVRATLAEYQRRQDAADFDEDAEAKLQRQRYAVLVQEMLQQATQYHSTALFVEAMLRELAQRTGMDLVTRAAAGTWGLNLLARHHTNTVIAAIAEAVLPAVYCRYDPSRLHYASPLIQVQLRDTATVEANPFFTHTMYVEQADAGTGKVAALQESLRHALRGNDSRRRFVLRTMTRWSQATLRAALLGWRAYVRRRRILAVMGDNRTKRQARESGELRVRATFYEWKALVEMSRNTFLTERLHEAATQLENAKNQFQLQCYRADRLIHDAKAARDELQAALRQNDALQRHVHSLEELLVEKEREYQKKLYTNVNKAFDLVRRYRRVLSLLVRDWPEGVAETTLCGSAAWQGKATHEIAELLAARRTAAAATHESEAAPSSTTGGNEGVEEGEGEHTEAKATTATTTAAEGDDNKATTPAVTTVNMTMNNESATKVLLQWCNAILRAAQAEHPMQVRNFSTDFASGVAFMVIFHYVLPATRATAAVAVTLSACYEMSVEQRLQKIRDLTSRQLRCALSPSDFTKPREDLIVLALVELRARYVEQRWRDIATRALGSTAEHLLHSNDTISTSNDERATVEEKHEDKAEATHAESAPPTVTNDDTQVTSTSNSNEMAIDDAAFDAFVQDCQRHFAETERRVAEHGCFMEQLARHTALLASEATHLVQERRKGIPLQLVSESSTRPFWNLKLSTLDDITGMSRKRYSLGGAAMSRRSPTPQLQDGTSHHQQKAQQLQQQLTGPAMRALLQRHVPTLTRLFYGYAGEGAKLMSEVEFWRFIAKTPLPHDDNNNNEDILQRENIARLFDRVASPHLANALQAAVHGKGGLDAETVMHVAQQEIDIRYISAAQFSEIVLRMARIVFDHGGAPPQAFPQSVEQFLNALRLPQTSALPPVLVTFYEPASQRVIRHFCDDLARMFFFYVRRQTASKVGKERAMATHAGGRFCALLSLPSYMSILHDCRYTLESVLEAAENGEDEEENEEYDDGGGVEGSRVIREDSVGGRVVQRGFVQPEQIARLLPTLQRYYVNGADDGISFPIFLELFAVLCHYWCPDPFVPQSRKMAAFLSHTVAMLSARHASTTLILSTPPQISLQGGPDLQFGTETVM